MSRRRPEQQLQRSLVEHLRWRGRADTWFCHIPNGGWRSKIEAAILHGQDVVPGCPDLLIISGGQAYFLELKSERGRVTDVQRACHEALRAAGAEVATACGLDKALSQLSAWGLLRPDVSNQIAGAFTKLRRDVAARRAARAFAVEGEHS